MSNIIKMQSANEMRQHREQFEAVFQRYRVSLHGLRPFDKEALRYAYGKFCNYDIELLESVIDEIAATNDKALAMANLCQELKTRINGKKGVTASPLEDDPVRDHADRTLLEAKIDKLCKLPKEQLDRIQAMFLESGHEAYNIDRKSFNQAIGLLPNHGLSFLLDFVRITMPELYSRL